MTTKPLTLLEATELMKTLELEDAVQSEDLNLFIERVEAAGKTIVNNKGGTDYLEDVSVFLLACSCAELLNNPDPMKIQIFMSMQENPEIFQLILGYAFTYSVGLGVVEELY